MSVYNHDSDYVVTSGRGHLDIDALACGFGMVDYLQQQGYHAAFVSSSPLNATVPDSLRSSGLSWKKTQPIHDRSKFIVCDVSDPDFFDPLVNQKQILEVIDHHFGFTEFWQQRAGVFSDIRPVAACASLVTRRFMDHKIEPDLMTARLLGTAILSNSLGLKLRLTQTLDHESFMFLNEYYPFKADACEGFFRECQEDFQMSPLENLFLDTKLTRISGMLCAIGQIEAWDRYGFSMKLLFEEFKRKFRDHVAVINMACVGESRNLIFTDDHRVLDMMEKLYPGQRHRDYYETENLLLLRKELCQDMEVFMEDRI
ncbi:MAG: hypothetical protein H6618_03485 [Deltaproteobacteria bacterium]|nr:hypothetical protein [Deltaproteobacteria bacterium]